MNIDSLDLKVLRYIVAVDQTKSISQAAKQLFVSHSSVSRAIAKVESELGMQLFYRTPIGMEVTQNGEEFVRQVHNVLDDIDSLHRFAADSSIHTKDALLVAADHSSVAENCFLDFYNRYGKNAERQNYVFLEGTVQDVIGYVSGGICNLGELTFTSDRSETIQRRLDAYGLDWTLLEQTPVCIQVRREHPLTKLDTVATSDLAPYPHIAFSGEANTNINYCSDVSKYNENAGNKRIIVCERGTLRKFVANTDGYYIGSNNEDIVFASDTDTVCIPIEDVKNTLDTYWIKRKNYTLTEAEMKYIDLMRNAHGRRHTDSDLR